MSRPFIHTPAPVEAPAQPAAGAVMKRTGLMTGHKYGAATCLALLLALFACGGNRQQDVLSKEQMVEAMREIYLAEEKTSRLGIRRDSSLQVFDSLEKHIFEDLAVSDSLFKKSLEYYWQRPEEMEQIYSILIDSLNLREQQLSLPGEE